MWQQSLAAKIEDSDAKEREHLRSAYENVRLRAQPLAEAIAKDLPDYTVHDITHSDALWEYADLIAGANIALNPCEAFVLGCAFLLHDLGLGLAAYPEGIVGLKRLTLWKDTVADILQKKGCEEINEQIIDNAGADIAAEAMPLVLRQLHAEKADRLALIHWSTPGNDARFYLIENHELRTAFGSIIGKIAFSHWWPVDKVAREFSSIMGAAAGFSQSWTVDPLKLACILRCADYAHIDERRAPAFLRALFKPEGESVNHWKFQEKLYQPRLEGDRLIYTAKSSFNIEDASAWWLCFDILNAIDNELRKVDSLLADTHRERFAARGVSQAEEPSRLSRIIKTDGWQPVDTSIRVSAVADLISTLGGRDLYGDRVTPPLRELIQNAADAVRARRLIDNLPEDWGEIIISTGQDSSGCWIQIQDTGIGMSGAVITGPLLDFGTSFWSSTLMHEQFPGLAAKGFQATGRYGIGFFSIFMWGERVEIVTQKFDKGRADTLVLSFKKGLRERPLLRQAKQDEYISDGGTSVKVWLSDAIILDKLMSIFEDEQKLSLAQVCAKIAPCLDVTIRVKDEKDSAIAVKANDWLSISDEDLLKRIAPEELKRNIKADDSTPKIGVYPKLKIINNCEGKPIGRAAICNRRIFSSHSGGIVTVGGLRASSLGGIIGVLIGTPTRATRDAAIPIISMPILREWAIEERDARLREGYTNEDLNQIADTLVCLGVEPIDFPIAKINTGWVTPKDVETLAKSIDEAIFVDEYIIDMLEERCINIKLKQGVFIVGSGFSYVLSFPTIHWREDEDLWPPINDEHYWRDNYDSRTNRGEVIRSLAKGWNVPITDILKNSVFYSSRERCEREIGTLEGKPLIEDVEIIRKPS